MEAEIIHTIVHMPDDRCLEVNYYCDNQNVEEHQKENFTKLIIQLDDCICTMLINKEICKNPQELEQIVLRKVINTRGHLC